MIAFQYSQLVPKDSNRVSEYDSAVKKLINILNNKLTELTTDKYCVIPSIEEICINLELASYRAVGSESNLEAIKKRNEEYELLSKEFEKQPTDIKQIVELLAQYKVKMLYSEKKNTISDNEEDKDSITVSSKSKESIMEQDVKLQHEQYSESDKQQLIKNGYSSEEIDNFLKDDVSFLLLKKLANKELSFSQEQSIACLENCIALNDKSIKDANEKDLIVVLGITGSGKSTAVDFWHGCTMVKEDQHIVVDPKSSEPPLAAIGHGKNSKTSLPKIVNSKTTGLTFCDCPGFEDNRGVEINIGNCVNVKNVLAVASSIKIVLLISYGSILTNRGNAIVDLKKAISNLFGETSNLESLCENIIIGITKVPVMVDYAPITIQFLKEKLFEGDDFPSKLKENTYIIDPLNRNKPNYALSRTEWIDKIKKLNPISKSTKNFQANLSATDKRFLLSICAELSRRIILNLQSRRFKRINYYFKLLVKLRVIGYPEIEVHIKDNLLELLNYVATDEQNFSESLQKLSPKEREEDFFQIREIIGNFQKDFPDMIEKLYNSEKFFQEKKVRDKLFKINGIFENIKKQYYEYHEDSILLSCAIFSNAKNLTNKSKSYDYVIAVIKEFQKLPKLNGLAFIFIDKLNGFVREYPNHSEIKLFQEKIKYWSDELDSILSNSQKMHEEYIYNKQSQLKKYIYECINFIISFMENFNNRNDFIARIHSLAKEPSYIKLCEFLDYLLTEKIEEFNVKILSLALKCLHEIDKSESNQKVFNAQLEFVCARFLALKDDLEVRKKKLEQDEKLRIEREKKQEEENQKLSQRENELRKLEEEMEKKFKLEQQAALEVEQQFKKFHELAGELEEKDRLLHEQYQQKILAQTQQSFNAIISKANIKNRTNKQNAFKQRQIEMLERRKKAMAILKKKLSGKNKFNFDALSGLDEAEDESNSLEANVVPEVSFEEIEKKVQKEFQEGRAKEIAKRNSEKEKDLKELDARLTELINRRKNGSLNDADYLSSLNELEKKAFELHFTSLFSTRGELYYELAVKEKNQVSRDRYYRSAIRDYKNAEYSNPSLPHIAQKFKEIEKEWRTQIKQLNDRSILFSRSKIDSKTNNITRKDLTPEEQEELERIKSEMRKLVGNPIKQ